MKLENVIVERPYKKVYRCEEGIAKVFEPTHPKEDVFNEALNQARVEATGLNTVSYTHLSKKILST